MNSPSVKYPAYLIHTPRLVIRCFELTDAIQLAAVVGANLQHLRPFMPWATEENADIDVQLQRLRRGRAKFDQDEEYGYGIFSRDEQLFLGGTGLHKRIGSDAIEIGYWIDKDHINQGLATETSAALTRVAFELLGVKRVEIHCDPQNLASAAVPRKLGYTLEATLRKRSTDYYGNPSDSMIWTLLEEEYPGSPASQLNIQAFDPIDRRMI
jgi:RimJ/RimL family protein N-acetyltransferase